MDSDKQYEDYHRIRAHRIGARGEDVIRVVADSVRPNGVQVKSGFEGAIELVHELSEFLSERYPTSFAISRFSSKHGDHGWGGAPDIRTITIVPLAETYELPPRDGGEKEAHRAMEIAALLVQDDLAVMVEGSDGKYYFQAGAICVAGFWRMRDKIGLPLEEIHISGDVPQYQAKLQISLERFFRRLRVDKPVVRNNYFIQVSPPPGAAANTIDPEELAWSNYVLGSEDLLHEKPPPNVKATPERLRLRTERQSLRRLPKSGAVVFTIRTYLFPVEDLAKENGGRVAGRFASAVKSWPEDVKTYKGEYRYGDVLVDYLEAQAASAKGPADGDRVYPF